jgi:hypothetical protein
MPRKPKRYWRIEIEQRQKIVFRCRLPGNLTENEIATVLQRLLCRELTAKEVIANSKRGVDAASLLHVRAEYPPRAKRTLVYLTHFPTHIASLWLASEIPDEPDIDQSSR